MLLEPLEAWSKLCASTSDWMERNALSIFEGLDLVNDCVKVKNVDALGPLAFEDRANLSLEQAQLARIHGARSNRQRSQPRLPLPAPLPAGKVRSRCGDGWDASSCSPQVWFLTRPGVTVPANRRPPLPLHRASAPCPRWNFAGLFRKRDRLPNGDAPLPCLLLNGTVVASFELRAHPAPVRFRLL